MGKICISFSAPVNNREKDEHGVRLAPPQRRGVGTESDVGIHVAANDLEFLLEASQIDENRMTASGLVSRSVAGPNGCAQLYRR
jgi:hypothetical protein